MDSYGVKERSCKCDGPSAPQHCKVGTWVTLSINYVDIDNRILLYCLMVRATVGQRQRQWMVAVGGGDGGGAPAFLLMCDTGDAGIWHTCGGGVDVVFLVGVGVCR